LFGFYSYRAQILNVEGETADIRYIDYGDKRQVKISDLRKIKPEFLKLKFQATLATLNLEWVCSVVLTVEMLNGLIISIW